MNAIGKVSNHDSYGGDTATYRGETVRVVLAADEVVYHSFSVTKTFPKTSLRATLGIRNAFDKAPPRVTTLGLGELSTQGNSAFYSQYDYYGRTINGSITWEF